MATLIQRLEAAKPTIQQILKLSGTVGMSYGILHEGKVVHTESFGFRDYGKKLSVDEKTIFPICSLTKAMLASAIGILVEDGKLSWETKVKDVIPDFRTHSQELHHSATILDFLSMRSGMQQYGAWLQSQNNVIFPREDSMKIINSFKQTQPLRQGFQYDNWAYELLSHVFPNTVGEDWGMFCSDHLFRPLGLGKTGTRASTLDEDNVARAYTVLDDAAPVQIRDVQLSDQTLMGAAGGVRSCVADLLTYYAAFLDAYTDQASSGKTATTGSPFKQVIPITSAHTQIPILGFGDQAYAMGWVKGRLPGPLSIISNNFSHLGSNVPEIGTNGPGIATLNHAGSMAGAMTAVIVFPESKSAIIVLTNTLGLSDTADTVSQLLTEVLFDLPEKHDFVALTQKIVAVEIESMSTIEDTLERERKLGTLPRDLRDYVGTYQNSIGTMKIDIMLQESKLVMRFQGLEEETFGLEHYEHDVFTWWYTRDECVRRGRFTNSPAEYFKIGFEGREGVIHSLAWKTGSADPEVFWKSK
ncbi:MAG: hypothetical protein Q9220_006274 [cf. Caloplaca sp. 1 TL-2023]